MTINNSSISSPVKDRADYDIFISYSRKDKDFVRQLWEALTTANQETWVDWDDIPPTADWRQEIYLGIEAANNFVFIITPHSISSVVCGEELLHAIKHGKRLVPIVRQDVDYQAVHPELAKLNWIFFREQDNFDSSFQTLIGAIETDLNHVRAHTRLLVRAREWQNKEHDSSFLLRGSDLESAEQWLTDSTKKPQPTTLHRDYINASRQAETERQETEIRLYRLSPQQYRNRQALLNKVKNYWVKGVLENSLHKRSLIELSLEERPQAVDHPWNLASEALDEPQKLLPQGTKIIDLFDFIGEGRTLLILGKPGSGKTTTLLELTQDLVKRAQQDLGQPIPVVFNLSSWIGEKQTISEWLVKELSIKYQVPKTVGQTWVNKQQLLLLLDGLDEVQDERREACINALNVFHQEYGSELVVTSRIKDYEVLSKRLNFQSAIYLRSLTPEQIYHSLEETTDSQLAGLRALLSNDDMLRQLAQSPLMLNIMAMAYQGISVEDLPETGFLEQRRAQLFNAYIEQMFKRRGTKQHYSKAQTMHWLSWLAQRMSQYSQAFFLIEGIQPTWLPTKAQQRAYQIGVKLLLMTIWGSLHVGLLAGLRDNPLTFNVFKGLEGLIYGLIGGLIYGVIGGLLGGLVDKSTNHLVGRSINGLLLGLIYGAIFVWVDGWRNGVSYALIYWLIGVIIYGAIHDDQEIEPVDTIKWSWRKAIKYSVLGLIIGVVLMFGAHQQPIPSLIFGLMSSLMFGFEKVNEIDTRTVPNQSIWKSAANAGKLFLTIGLPTGLLLGVIRSPVFGLANGLMFGLASGLIGGQGAGIVCIKHFIVRCILWRSGYIPWNYAQFLDYASDRIFLQKVGGGYVFIHRMLLEHFAEMQPTKLHS
ncbi:MAG TPA: TIR domain-containing protein [Coleofasciculaceae cyanobacterium]|jgi:DNA polymerase III delta prime subunit